MVKLEFSVLLNKAVNEAKFDRAKALEVLEMMLPYLDDRRPLPADLARYLAGAIRAAVASSQPDRTLAERLHLRRKAGRPGIDMIAVATAVEEELGFGAASINEAAERVSRRGTYAGLDASTIKKHYREYVRIRDLAVQSSNDPNPETRWGDT